MGEIWLPRPSNYYYYYYFFNVATPKGWIFSGLYVIAFIYIAYFWCFNFLRSEYCHNFKFSIVSALQHLLYIFLINWSIVCIFVFCSLHAGSRSCASACVCCITVLCFPHVVFAAVHRLTSLRMCSLHLVLRLLLHSPCPQVSAAMMAHAPPHVVTAIQSDAAACVPTEVCLTLPHVSAASILYVVLKVWGWLDTYFCKLPCFCLAHIYMITTVVRQSQGLYSSALQLSGFNLSTART